MTTMIDSDALRPIGDGVTAETWAGMSPAQQRRTVGRALHSTAQMIEGGATRVAWGPLLSAAIHEIVFEDDLTSLR